MLRRGFAWLAATAFAVSLGYFLYSYFTNFGSPVSGGRPELFSNASMVNVAAFTIFALHHSLFARTRLKAAVRRMVSPQLERSVYTAVASGMFVLVCAWWQTVPGEVWRLSGVWRICGYAVQGAGIILTIAGARSLDALELAGVRQAQQSATRAPELKTHGIYGFVRHPLYFSWVLLVFGAPHMTGTRLCFALISTLYLMVAIPFEERGLIESFGPAYASYKKTVRWRMLPGIY